MKKILTFCVSVVFPCMALLAFISLASAATITVGSDESSYDYITIQAGIDAAYDGDTVLVADGTYTEDENINLDFRGKEITVTSENDPEDCIIDCEKSGLGFYFHNEEGSGSVLNGFTIQNGLADFGGGIYCSSSSPTITNCTITGNSATHGGGICCLSSSSPTIINCTITGNSTSTGGGGICCVLSSSPTIINCTITGNLADFGGAGMFCAFSSPTITNCTISGNSTLRGGGIYCSSSSPTITNCTITENSATHGGGIYCEDSSSPTITNCTITGNSFAEDWVYGAGICCLSSSSPTITNCILWNDSSDEIFVLQSSPIVTFSDIQLPDGELYPGWGNINADPLFDFADGRFLLSADSPCIDFGTTGDDIPTHDKDGNPRDEYPDMGAYEYIIQSIEVDIDIKPGSETNPLNIKGRGALPVAILGAENFDISLINPTSIELLGVAPQRWRQKDCNKDGYMDLMLKFKTKKIVKALGEVNDGDEIVLPLSGELSNGIAIEGQDTVLILKKGKKKKGKKNK